MWPNPQEWSHLLKKSLMENFIFCVVSLWIFDISRFLQRLMHRWFSPKNCLDNQNILQKNTAQKLKFSVKDFFSNCDDIRRKLLIWTHLLKKSLMENFSFCAIKGGKATPHLRDCRQFKKENLVNLHESILCSAFSNWKRK